MVVTLTEFHSMALLHARMAALVEFVLWQQPEPSSTSATFAMPLLVEPLSMRLRTSDVRCRCACRMDVPTFSAGASSKVRSSMSTESDASESALGWRWKGRKGLDVLPRRSNDIEFIQASSLRSNFTQFNSDLRLVELPAVY